mgnify:FL=1
MFAATPRQRLHQTLLGLPPGAALEVTSATHDAPVAVVRHSPTTSFPVFLCELPGYPTVSLTEWAVVDFVVELLKNLGDDYRVVTPEISAAQREQRVNDLIAQTLDAVGANLSVALYEGALRFDVQTLSIGARYRVETVIAGKCVGTPAEVNDVELFGFLCTVQALSCPAAKTLKGDSTMKDALRYNPLAGHSTDPAVQTKYVDDLVAQLVEQRGKKHLLLEKPDGKLHCDVAAVREKLRLRYWDPRGLTLDRVVLLPVDQAREELHALLIDYRYFWKLEPLYTVRVYVNRIYHQEAFRGTFEGALAQVHAVYPERHWEIVRRTDGVVLVEHFAAV